MCKSIIEKKKKKKKQQNAVRQLILKRTMTMIYNTQNIELLHAKGSTKSKLCVGVSVCKTFHKIQLSGIVW